MDPALKRIFGHAASIEMLVREFASEHAQRIDFSKLEKLSTALVGEALVRRYPDMLWSAPTLDGKGRVVILLEFQGDNEPLMSVRTAVYGLLTVQELLERMQRPPATASLEVLTLVIHHGRSRWNAPTELAKVFSRWVPGDYRVISRDRGGCESGATHDDLAGVILRFEQERSVEGTLTALGDLKRIGESTGVRFDRFLAECIRVWLLSQKRITKDQMQEAATMAQVVTEYERSLEAFGRKWFHQGRDEGRAGVLCDLAARRFGASVGEQLADLLGDPPDSAKLSEASSAVIDCATAQEFLRRVRSTTNV